ncbi:MULTISPECIES: hypothetical protein [Streptomycetaceae]|uniref:hypothetical protein n=1 Tax=Streptomycetaceae TaxID=2062 RepID=UPI0003621411|nr:MULTISPECIES: hypothetical protein [Streptomycetaceae]
MSALPGQRAAQRPMRAAVSVQRAIGRTVADGGASTGVLVLNVGGEWMQQVIDEDGQEQLVPYQLDEGED